MAAVSLDLGRCDPPMRTMAGSAHFNWLGMSKKTP